MDDVKHWLSLPEPELLYRVGVPEKGPEKDLCWSVLRVPQMTQSGKGGWTALKRNTWSESLHVEVSCLLNHS